MGHHSKKKNQGTPPPVSPQPNMNNLGQLFNNIDVNSMSNMLNNIDVNQVMSMLSKSFVPPITAPPQNTNSSNTVKNEGSTPLNYPNMNLFSSIPGFAPVPPQQNLDPVLPPNDPTVLVLNSIKPFLPPDKCLIIDNMIQLLGIKAVIDKIFPPAAQVKNSENTKSNSEENKTDDKTSNDNKETK